MKNKDLNLWAAKQTKSRQRPRSTVFDDGVSKAEKRQQRRQSDKRIIEDELDLEEQILEDLGIEDYYFGD